ncbi:hypothetical protein SS50377_22435 [Spironucleus salmonicida]|uniref:Uncharacterized protein n=1 Tax=Spironucleus salmonicida TaxID=348837 RepID=V6LMY1_9EUKA|nr:hypothetical protein SS50377_22435 [Spironucleus salmonicida]|eukprot:EST42074.1 Hypothetical protein SS50377_18381 [Spironucleus salmonicida]
MSANSFSNHTGQLRKNLPKFVKNYCSNYYISGMRTNVQMQGYALTNFSGTEQEGSFSNNKSDNMTPVILDSYQSFEKHDEVSILSAQNEVLISTPTKQIYINAQEQLEKINDKLNSYNSNAPIVSLDGQTPQTSQLDKSNVVIKSTSVQNLYNQVFNASKIKHLKKNNELHPDFTKTLNPQKLTEEQLLVQLLAKYEPDLLHALQRHRKQRRTRVDENGNLISQETSMTNMTCMAETPSQFMGKLKRNYQHKVDESIKQQTIIDKHHYLKNKIRALQAEIDSGKVKVINARTQLEQVSVVLGEQLAMNEKHEENLCDMKISQAERMGF